MIAWLGDELRRQWRGWLALRAAFGPTFTAAIAFVMGLLLAALFARCGIAAFVLGGVMLLLAVRAHDLGDLPEASDPSPEAQQEREAAFLAEQEAAREAQVRFLADRHSAALGRPHDGSEL